MAKYKKKRARELKHDRFRDTTMSLVDRTAERLEGKGRTILYALGGIVLAGILILLFMRWSGRKSDEARAALGRAIDIATATVSTSTTPDPTAGTVFASEEQRAQRAIEEFKKAYKEEFGILLSDDQVQEIAVRLLRFFGILSDESLRDKKN